MPYLNQQKFPTSPYIQMSRCTTPNVCSRVWGGGRWRPLECVPPSLPPASAKTQDAEYSIWLQYFQDALRSLLVAVETDVTPTIADREALNEYREGGGAPPLPHVGGHCGPVRTLQAAPLHRKQSITPPGRSNVSLGAEHVHMRAGLMWIRSRRGRGRSPPLLVRGRCGPAPTHQAAPLRRQQSIAPPWRRSVSLGAG
jgi:hypothetical protein